MMRAIAILTTVALAAGCQSPPTYEPGTSTPEGAQPGAQPAAPGSAGSASPQAPAVPPAPPKQFHLGQASTALVTQAHAQAAAGNAPLALTTIERALRIEPDNPLLWIELGEVHEGAGNYAQADAMGRKALQLASGDPHAQSSAWRLIAESLRARGRNAEAAEADGHARALSAR